MRFSFSSTVTICLIHMVGAIEYDVAGIFKAVPLVPSSQLETQTVKLDRSPSQSHTADHTTSSSTFPTSTKSAITTTSEHKKSATEMIKARITMLPKKQATQLRLYLKENTVFVPETSAFTTSKKPRVIADKEKEGRMGTLTWIAVIGGAIVAVLLLLIITLFFVRKRLIKKDNKKNVKLSNKKKDKPRAPVMSKPIVEKEAKVKEAPNLNNRPFHLKPENFAFRGPLVIMDNYELPRRHATDGDVSHSIKHAVIADHGHEAIEIGSGVEIHVHNVCPDLTQSSSLH